MSSNGSSRGRAGGAVDASVVKKKRRVSSESVTVAAAAGTRVDDAPEFRPVDPMRLPEDVRKYREERAKHWPSDRNVRAKLEAGEEERRRRVRAWAPTTRHPNNTS